MKKKSIYFLFIIFLGIFFVNTISAYGAKTIVLKYAGYMNPDGASEGGGQWWMDEVEKRSKGRVKFERYNQQSLLKLRDLTSGTARGIADLCLIPPGYEPSKFPLGTIWDLPYLIRSPYLQNRVQHELMKTYPPIQEEFAKQGLRLVMASTCGTTGIFTTKKQVKTLEDLKGLKIRTYGYVSEAYNRLGAVSVSMPLPEQYTALQRGTVDGCNQYIDSARPFKLEEVCKYCTVNTGLELCCTCYMFMNLDTWNNLPSDVKAIIEDIDDEWPVATARRHERLEQENVPYLKKKGMILYKLPDEELERWTKKINPKELFADWIATATKRGTPYAEELINKVKELAKKYKPSDKYMPPYESPAWSD